ncbi:hypothetical protein K488DRAFT_69102 [Vararia minispora EC-137]|uniref:Uncharacterized protein n=1 Tax=Vararia minispora EC-137 TaxID=1314806 RepID=A0ACB8QSX0_9AGAM|nr:hypothetical protein K488DRAFT_69102 [Vararia minispora EC-137]
MQSVAASRPLAAIVSLRCTRVLKFSHTFTQGYQRAWLSTTSSSVHAKDEFFDGLGHLIENIREPTEADQEDMEYSGDPLSPRYVASYNWMDAPEPAITVPGLPPILHGRKLQLPTTLTHFPRPAHLFKHFRSPLLQGPNTYIPLFAAADSMARHRPVDWPALDVISTSGLLYLLMKWIGGYRDREFRIDGELVGERTLVLYPRFKSQPLVYNPCDSKMADAPLGPVHQRILSLNCSNLRMLVRYSIRAFVPAGAGPHDSTATSNVGIPLENARHKPKQAAKYFRGDDFRRLYLTSFSHYRTIVTKGRNIVNINGHVRFRQYKYRRLWQAFAKEYSMVGQLLGEVQRIVMERGTGTAFSLVGRTATGLKLYEREHDGVGLPPAVRARFESHSDS